MELPASNQEKIKLIEINQYLTCYLCKGYFIDATTISECLHSFCRSCIIKFLHDKSYCPVCELIINKAKPNLKLDKTRQDIVYKLVPELFLKEMLRRKTLYKNHPEIAAKVSPEERGEDTERTIFNPQEMISLSLEYIRDDSTPGAIRIPGIVTDVDALKNNGSTEEGQESQMKRYLLCPGMCRIEVLKKFIRNKYNVDTNQFFIDVLYKRVPLPDHYTLIDIAYIYSWQRNELMKFFFRIIDNKTKPTDTPTINLPQFIPRHLKRTRSNGERVKRKSPSEKKPQRKSVSKVNNGATKAHNNHEIKKEPTFYDEKEIVDGPVDAVKCKSGKPAQVCDDVNLNASEHDRVQRDESSSLKLAIENIKVKEEKCSDGVRVNAAIEERKDFPERKDFSIVANKTDKENNLGDKTLKNEQVPNEKVLGCKQDTIAASTSIGSISSIVAKAEKLESKKIALKNSLAPCKHNFKVPQLNVKKEQVLPDTASTDNKFVLKISREWLDDSNRVTPQPQVISKPVTKSYTSITLNRSENVEIITEIEPVSNKNGKSIGHHIIKQTIKKGSKVKSANCSKKIPIPRLRISSQKAISKKISSKRRSTPAILGVQAANPEIAAPKIEFAEANNAPDKILQSFKHLDDKLTNSDISDEKLDFFKYIQLAPNSRLGIKTENVDSQWTNSVKKEITEVTLPQPVNQEPKKQIIISRGTGGQKRKNASPTKNERSKILQLDAKRALKVFLQGKSSTAPISDSNVKNDEGLQSLINTCKIPSSLSITIKQGSESDSLPLVVPPVKNYIEILKLPEEPSSSDKLNSAESENLNQPAKLDLSKFCDNDSEQKVDEDISEIAKSLTEKIPISTTVSQIIAPKPQFQIPMKTNIPSKVPIQPAQVPEVNKALGSAESPKGKLVKQNQRSSQSFQKIFEESLKKPSEGPKVATIELSTSESNTANSGKRKILEIASQLFKKTKLEQERNGNVALPKVPIPRLPNCRIQKTLTSQPVNKMVPQTVASLHSSSLGLNYTVSVGQQSPSKVMKAGGVVSPVKTNSVPEASEGKPSELNEANRVTLDFKVPAPTLGSPKLPEVASSSSCSTPRPKTPSPKHSPKSSPLVKHMYAPSFNQRVPSPMSGISSLSPSNNAKKLKRLSTSPKPSASVPNAKSPATISPIESKNPAAISANEIADKYNFQVYKKNFNLNPVLASNQLAAFQQAILLKHFEMQNRQNWLNRNQGPLLQYEKYLQSLNGGINGSQSQT